LLAALAVALGGCESPVGYRGPLPSLEARGTVNALEGAVIPAGSVRFTDHELVVRRFIVLPTYPAVILEETAPPDDTNEPKRFWVPVLTDGDIADLHRLTGREFPLPHSGELSAEYRRYTHGE
jgi:hypothetical protein